MSDVKDKKVRTKQILDVLKSSIGKPMPNVHKSPMVTSEFNGKIVSAERGEVETEFIIQPKMTNPLGLLHGGMQCTLMDDIIGITVATLGL
ncbi:MAG: PaaI family thioesterase, partial [Promethearchaeota archaeon]